jgi:hypothetical protein
MKHVNLNTEETANSDLSAVRRSIYEYFTDAEIGLFAHLVKEHSKAGVHSEYKQGKLDKLEAKLKQLRSF